MKKQLFWGSSWESWSPRGQKDHLYLLASDLAHVGFSLLDILRQGPNKENSQTNSETYGFSGSTGTVRSMSDPGQEFPGKFRETDQRRNNLLVNAALEVHSVLPNRIGWLLLPLTWLSEPVERSRKHCYFGPSPQTVTSVQQDKSEVSI